jgi:hypothetical protein|nr:MAG TPA: hypothetical protein [Caudoviricetes sp.]
MAYRIEITQTRKAYLYAGTSNKFEALDFACRFMRDIENLNQLDFKSTKYEVGDAVKCAVKEDGDGSIEIVEEEEYGKINQ